MTNLARKSWFVVHTKPRSEECAATFLRDRRGRGRDLAIEAARATTRNGGRAKGSTAARPAAVSHMEIAASLPPSCRRFGDRDLLQGALRAVLDKVPDSVRAEVKAHVLTMRDAPTWEAGRQAAVEVLERYGRLYPSAMASLSDDLEARLHHLRVPVAHRRYVRTTNLIERSFLEERRRTKIIPRFFDERSCLKLVFATLQRASQRWQRVRITELEQKQLLVLRQHLGLDPDPAPTHQATQEAA